MANTGPNTNSSQFFITFAPVYVYTYIFFQQKKHAAWQTRVQTPTARSSSSRLRPSRGSTADTPSSPALRVVQACVGVFTIFTLLLYCYRLFYFTTLLLQTISLYYFTTKDFTLLLYYYRLFHFTAIDYFIYFLTTIDCFTLLLYYYRLFYLLFDLTTRS